MIKVGARFSPLSQAQVREVLLELRIHHPDSDFQPLFLKTTGDLDLKSSLRGLEKTNFFTKEVDDLLVQGLCRIAIHSAKDLPASLPEGLKIIAITEGVDSADVLVLRSGESFDALPSRPVIATSSERREAMVSLLRSDFLFKDLRGTIAQRLSKLDSGEADGVVVAEAALIRLGLTHLNRVRLPGDGVALQGKLAIVARHDDDEMHQLFACLDSRSLCP